MDDVIKRTVKLIKYKNDIKEIVEKGKQQVGSLFNSVSKSALYLEALYIIKSL